MLAEELDGFWNKLKSKVNNKLNSESIDDVDFYNEQIRKERNKEKELRQKKDNIKPLEDVKPKNYNIPLTDRELNFKKDSTKELGYKINLDKYKKHHKEIANILKQRKQNKKDKEERYKKSVEDNQRKFRKKQELEKQK